jgi:hypothetical protein
MVGVTSMLYVTMTILGFIMYEVLFVLFVWWICYGGRSFERGGANMYLVFYSFCLGFMLMGSMDLYVMTVLVSLIGFSKLPVFGLHA